MVAIVRAGRREYASSREVEVVSARGSHAIIPRTRATRRPIDAPLASAPESTSSIRQSDDSAAHEVELVTQLQVQKEFISVIYSKITFY